MIHSLLAAKVRMQANLQVLVLLICKAFRAHLEDVIQLIQTYGIPIIRGERLGEPNQYVYYHCRIASLLTIPYYPFFVCEGDLLKAFVSTNFLFLMA